jgi:HAD superfamily, subfamily IIIB (Acid phosphatase)
MARPRTSSLRLRIAAATAAAAVVGTGLFAAGAATAGDSAPRTDKQIVNLTTEIAQIKAYYGDTVVNGEHYASPDSNYAKQVDGIEHRAERYLAHSGHGLDGAKPAITLDVDDTTLLTYNYEMEVGFNYTPASNDTYIRTKNMDPVFGMVKLVNWAQDHGISVFWVTGRPEAQREPTARNLAAVGYHQPADGDHLFLKNPASPPAYLTCGATCTTAQYKDQTRAYIESKGYKMVASFGDQYNDLEGTHTGRTFKLPNPMYMLS